MAQMGGSCSKNGFGFFRRSLFLTLAGLAVAFPTRLGAEPQSLANTSSAGNDLWRVELADHNGMPGFLLTVDKEEQTVKIFERQSPTRLTMEIQCTTGQTSGDKLVQGDRKTPEGIYFIEKHITSGLDYAKYGNEAYTLNYPNPVDRLRQKTGYGIWIHGKGVPLAPRLTEGCVALNNEELAALGPKLHKGMPVALAADVNFSEKLPSDKAGDVLRLEQKVKTWARAWSDRSSTMFDHYNSSAYTASTESFSAFKSQKERLFKNFAWIDTTVSDIQILEGPGYWVTWFFQDYKAPNLSTSGTRRLYWEKDNKGEFRIIGMEWEPGLQNSVYYADAGKDSVSDAASPKGTGPTALPPEETETPSLLGAEWIAATPATNQDSTSAGYSQGTPETSTLAENSRKSIVESSVSNASPVTNQPLAASPAKQTKNDTSEKNKIAVSSPEKTSTQQQKNVSPAKTETALLSQPKITGKNTAEKPQPAKTAVDPMRSLAPEGAELVEQWRRAWEKGDVNSYISFYAPNAKQGGRTGAAQIRDQKAALWKRVKPALVKLTHIQINKTDTGLLIMMDQQYRDSSGFQDNGIKILSLEPVDSRLRIVREDWVPAN